MNNEWGVTNSGLQLFMSAPSGLTGGLSYNESMPLFMARDSDSIEYSCPLYLKAVEGDNNYVTLCVSGAYRENSNITLVVPNVESSGDSNISMFTHGY